MNRSGDGAFRNRLSSEGVLWLSLPHHVQQDRDQGLIFMGERSGIRRSRYRVRGEIGGEKDSVKSWAMGTRANVWTDRQHGHGGAAKDLFGNGSHQELLSARATVGTEHDQVDMMLGYLQVDCGAKLPSPNTIRESRSTPLSRGFYFCFFHLREIVNRP